MTYVEKMTMRIMGELAYNYGNQSETAKTVQQIIADTKRAHLKAIKPFSNFQSMNYSAYVDAIDQAEIKEK